MRPVFSFVFGAALALLSAAVQVEAQSGGNTSVSTPITIPGTNDLIGISTTVQQVGPNPYLLALMGVTLLMVLAAFFWFSKTSQTTVSGMIKGAEERAKEDRSMYRTEAQLSRETFERSLERMAKSHEDSIGKISDGLNRVSDGLHDLEQRMGDIHADEVKSKLG